MSIGWAQIGDLSQYAGRDAIEAALAATTLAAEAGAIPVRAGTIERFRTDMQVGELVVYPDKVESTINFGKISGGYEYLSGGEAQPNRRPVERIKTGAPRTTFPNSVLNEIGSTVTLFRVSKHDHVFRAFLDSGPSVGGTALIEPLLDHYGRLDNRWKDYLPIRRVYAVDQELDLE